MPRNERLAAAISDAGLSTVGLALDVDVDPKTVERWIVLGRIPHPRRRAAVAERLGTKQSLLWDGLSAKTSEQEDLPGEVVAIYPTRRDVPLSTWRSLIAATQSRFELHAFAATFLPDQAMDLASELLTLADRGVHVRLLLGDPDGKAVQQRSTEEGGTGLAGRISLVLGYIARAINDPRIEVRLHDETLYASLFRFDDDLFVNTHVWGSPAGSNPLMHLREQEDSPLVASWQGGFERTWDSATPLTAWPRDRSSATMD